MRKEYENRKETEQRRLTILKQVFHNGINDELEFDSVDKKRLYDDFDNRDIEGLTIDTYKFVSRFQK